MTETERKTQIRDFNSLKVFESKHFKISTPEDMTEGECDIVRFPNGYMIVYHNEGVAQSLFMPNDFSTHM